MAYTIGFPPKGPTQPHLDQPSLPQKTGDSGDAGDKTAAAKPATAGLADRHDPYAEAFKRALGELNRPDYPRGMMPWLADANPVLYTELTVRIPDELQRLWSGRAPLKDFDRVLRLWVEAHRTACELFRAARGKH